MSPQHLEAEADRLRQVIEQNAEPLRTAVLGRTFRLGDFDFQLHGAGRNTIYRVRAAGPWFLKLTRDASSGAMVHEQLGASAIADAIGQHPLYHGASVMRVSLEPAYVLAAAIPGRPLNTELLKFALSPLPGASETLTHIFATMGTLLGSLHNGARVGSDAVGATTRPFQALDDLLARAKRPDDTIRAIATWCGTHRHGDEGGTFQHGNFRLDNILRVGNRLGFIDFENCGTGTMYQDLSRPVSELLLTRTLIVFPTRRVTRSIDAFLNAYAAQRPFDPGTLSDHITARLGRYYVESHARGFRASIGGIPVSRRKLTALMQQFIAGGLAAAAPELHR